MRYTAIHEQSIVHLLNEDNRRLYAQWCASRVAHLAQDTESHAREAALYAAERAASGDDLSWASASISALTAIWDSALRAQAYVTPSAAVEAAKAASEAERRAQIEFLVSLLKEELGR